MPSSKWVSSLIKLAVLGHSRGGHLFNQRALPSLVNDWMVIPVTQSSNTSKLVLPQVSTVPAGEPLHRNQGGVTRFNPTMLRGNKKAPGVSQGRGARKEVTTGSSYHRIHARSMRRSARGKDHDGHRQRETVSMPPNARAARRRTHAQTPRLVRPRPQHTAHVADDIASGEIIAA